MPVCLSFVSCHSTCLWLTGVVKSQRVECCGCHWGFVPSEVFSWRGKAKVKPSAATGCLHIASRGGFLFPSHQLFLNVDCLLRLQSLCVCGCVSLHMHAHWAKNTTWKRKFSLEVVTASQLQRRLHRSVVLSWMPSSTVTQMFKEVWESAFFMVFSAPWGI